MIGELIVDAIKVGGVTLFGSAVTKVLNQKEISQLITGVGLTVVGVDLLGVVAPVCNWVMDLGKTVGNGVNTLNNWGLVLDKIIHLGG